MGGVPFDPNPEIHPLMVKLRERRKALGLTQRQVADRLGVVKSNVTQMEKGYNNPGVDKMCRYAEAVDCTLELVPNEQPRPQLPRPRTLREIFGSKTAP